MSVEVETVRTVEVPTLMVHGPGAIGRLGEIVEELGVRRPLLVTDGGVVAAGLAEKAIERLTDASVFDGVKPNPDVELIGRTSEVYREEGCDGLVALGLLAGWVAKGFGDWKFGRARGIVLALLGFWAWAAVSAFLSPDQALGWGFVEKISKIILPFLVGITTIDSVRKLKQLAWTIFL